MLYIYYMLSIIGERVCQKRYFYTILGDYSQNKRNYTFGTLFVIKYLFTVFCYGKNSCGSCQESWVIFSLKNLCAVYLKSFCSLCLLLLLYASSCISSVIYFLSCVHQFHLYYTIYIFASNVLRHITVAVMCPST